MVWYFKNCAFSVRYCSPAAGLHLSPSMDNTDIV